MALEKEEQPEEEWGREEEEEEVEEEEEEGKNSAGTFEGESLSEHTAGKASSLHARWRKQQAELWLMCLQFWGRGDWWWSVSRSCSCASCCLCSACSASSGGSWNFTF